MELSAKNIHCSLDILELFGIPGNPPGIFEILKLSMQTFIFSFCLKLFAVSIFLNEIVEEKKEEKMQNLLVLLIYAVFSHVIGRRHRQKRQSITSGASSRTTQLTRSAISL